KSAAGIAAAAVAAAPNAAATGKPTITGTATVGQTLTAAKGTIADTNGTAKAEAGDAGFAWTYQWVRVDSDGTSNAADISGATSKTYTLTADDEGKKVKVRVGFQDDLGNAETRTSDAFPSAGTIAASGTGTVMPSLDAVWSATLTVGSASASGYCKDAGISDCSYGSLSSTTFTLKGTTYTVESLRRGSRRLHLTLDKDFPEDDLSDITLRICQTDLALSDAARGSNRGGLTSPPNNYYWRFSNVDEFVAGTKVAVKILLEQSAPAKPTGLNATPGSALVTLSWTDLRDETITKHQFQQTVGNAAWGSTWTDVPNSAPGGTNATSYTVTSLANGTAYRFRIRAVNAQGNSPESDATGPVTPQASTTAVSAIAVTSNPPSGQGGHYKTGDKIAVTVTFTEAVTVTGTPELRIRVGTGPGSEKIATCVAHASENTKLVCTWTVAEGAADANGIAVEAGKLTGTIQDSSNGPASLAYTAIADSARHKVDAVRPTVKEDETGYYGDAALTKPLTGSVKAGVKIYTKVTFSEDMKHVKGNQLEGHPYLQYLFGNVGRFYDMLNPGDDLAHGDCKPNHASRTDVYVCLYTVQAGDNTTSFWVSVNAGADSANNALERSYRHDTSLALDTSAPAAPRSLVVTPGNAQVRLAWDDPSPADASIAKWQVRQKTTGEYGEWQDIPGGASARSREVTSLENGTAYTFEVRAVDAATNEGAAGTAGPVTPSGNAAATGKPSITGTATAGETLTAAKGTIADADGLTKADNGDAGYAYTYQWVRVDSDGSGNPTDISGATSKTYVPVAADVGRKVKVRVGFKDDLGNPESRTSDAFPSATTIAADTTGPAVSVIAVTSNPPSNQGGHYKAGDTIAVTVTFNETIAVVGSPTLKIRVGSGSGTAKTATCARKGDSGDDAKKLVCSYTVQSGDADTDGISVERNMLALGTNVTIRDSNNNDATLTYTALAAQSGHKVDTAEPGISFPSSPAVPTVGTAVTITLTDATAKVAKYAVVEVAGTATDATGCDDPGEDSLTLTAVDPVVASKEVSYTPVAAAKKICVYAEDAAGNGDSELWATPIQAADGTAPTVTANETGYFSDVAAATALPGPVKGGVDVYTKVTFSEDMKHVKGDGTDARPALFYRIGTSDTQYDILNNADTLASGDCKPEDATSTDVYICRYTVAAGVNGAFRVKVGTNSADKATNTLENAYSHSATLTLDTTAPAAPAGLAATAGDTKVTLTWNDPSPADATIAKWQYRQKTTGNYGTWQDISGASTRSHEVTSLINGTAYTFQVRAVDTASNEGAAGTAGPATPSTADNTAPTVSSAGYFSNAAATTALTGPQKAGVDIYTKVTFSEDMNHVKSNGAAARPEIFHRIGTTDTQYDILNNADTLASGDCRPNHASETDEYVCRYTVGLSVNGDFTVKVGTNSADTADNALASEYTHDTTLTLDTTTPAKPGALALASGTASPGNDATPEIEVTVGETGGTVTLYSDNACMTAASAAKAVTGTETPYKVTVPATALASDGSVTFYAEHADAAENASACSTESVAYVYDGTNPGIAFPSGVTPTVGTAATITLTDATAKVAKYAIREVEGTASDATGCDDPSGDSLTLTSVDPAAASEEVSYTPLAATKKICVYAEDAAGNSDSDLWTTPIAAAPNAAPTFSSAATFDAAENQTAVGTVVAADADSGDGITGYAITGGVDAGKFSIGSTSGVLTFKTAPDFETPGDVLSTTPSNAAGNNEYVLVVTATGGTGGRALTAAQTITVTVTNVDEAGAVSFGSATPTVGTALTASLADPDGSVSSLTWKWAKAESQSGSYTDISGATSASYTPVAADLGKWLRATASYTDGHGASKSAAGTAAAAVADGTAPTVTANETGYFSDVAAATALPGPVKGGVDVYTKVTFSEDMKHVKGDGTDARPALFYRIGTSDTQYDILNNADTLASGDCRPNHASETDEYVCRYTVGLSVNGDFTVKVGTNSADTADNALASEYTHDTTLTLDTTTPAKPGALALASGTASPGNDATPEIEVTVGETGGTVTLYSDNACMTAASAAKAVTGTETPYKVTVPATALASDGSVTFYAEHADAAENASACSTESVAYVYDGTNPGIAFPSGVTPTVGTAATITLTDATAKVAKYAIREVEGTASDATGCDDPSASGDDFTTTPVDPAASPKTVDYTPVTAGKKVCVYAEDAAGNSDSKLWTTPISAAPNAAPTFSSATAFDAAENQTAVGTVVAAD
ncbi:MAG: hypothetical protein F4213_06570, partial [Boseongicola sp. SB0677_bin_26]|nr:hypothetical protein [Boseongicola sp. SB0677_bin_26]